jgi:hypothetical protein
MTGTDADLAPTLVQGGVRDGAIQADGGDERLRELVFERGVVVLKGALDPERMLELRRAARRWSSETPEYPDGRSPESTPMANYHRIDDGSHPSAFPHVFHQYGLNSLTDLPDNFREPAATVAQQLIDLQNRVAQTSFGLDLQGQRAKLLHYPAGGGFLAEHVHRLEPQRVGLILSLSRLGVDTTSGGTTFTTPSGLVDASAHHDAGDIAIFRYDLPHAVSAVDAGETIDWASDRGKWSFVLELRDNYRQSLLADS